MLSKLIPYLEGVNNNWIDSKVQDEKGKAGRKKGLQSCMMWPLDGTNPCLGYEANS